MLSEALAVAETSYLFAECLKNIEGFLQYQGIRQIKIFNLFILFLNGVHIIITYLCFN